MSLHRTNKKFLQLVPGLEIIEWQWLWPLFVTLLIFITLFLAATLRHRTLHQDDSSLFSLFTSTNFAEKSEDFVEEELAVKHCAPLSAASALPKLAYLISGTKGDSRRMKRVLQAVYHPHNIYLLHLDLEAHPKERIDLARYAKLHPLFIEAGNVNVMGKANLITYRGPTMTACTLHAASSLLKSGQEWDWFINLSASDYPLVTQDDLFMRSGQVDYIFDLLYVLSYLPRDLNFIEHTSQLGWKEFQRIKPVAIDPGLYLTRKTDLMWAKQRRPMPDALKLFVGSAWIILTRHFMEYCIWGWDNLPRTVLMYYTNIVSSPEGYFHTVICNAEEFRNTTVNHDLHYIAWDIPPKQHPLSLGLKHFNPMKNSGAAFARKFQRDDPVLDKIDMELLNRTTDRFTPGGWCVGGSSKEGSDPCAKKGDPHLLAPGPGAKRLEGLILQLLSLESFRANQCKITA